MKDFLVDVRRASDPSVPRVKAVSKLARTYEQISSCILLGQGKYQSAFFVFLFVFDSCPIVLAHYAVLAAKRRQAQNNCAVQPAILQEIVSKSLPARTIGSK
jgi:hypothetical protein